MSSSRFFLHSSVGLVCFVVRRRISALRQNSQWVSCTKSKMIQECPFRSRLPRIQWGLDGPRCAMHNALADRNRDTDGKTSQLPCSFWVDFLMLWYLRVLDTHVINFQCCVTSHGDEGLGQNRLTIRISGSNRIQAYGLSSRIIH